MQSPRRASSVQKAPSKAWQGALGQTNSRKRCIYSTSNAETREHKCCKPPLHGGQDTASTLLPLTTEQHQLLHLVAAMCSAHSQAIQRLLHLIIAADDAGKICIADNSAQPLLKPRPHQGQH
jgi:hypothetical protein